MTYVQYPVQNFRVPFETYTIVEWKLYIRKVLDHNSICIQKTFSSQ